MNGTFCANFLLQLSSLPDLREFRSPLIVKCVFKSFFSYTAIMLNIVTVYPMQKPSSLPKNLTTLLLSLAITDVLVICSIFSYFLVKWLAAANAFLSSLRSSVLWLLFQQVGWDSSSSQKLGACDRQACSYCGDLYGCNDIYVGVMGVTIGFSVTFVVYIRIYLTVRPHNSLYKITREYEAMCVKRLA